MRQAAPGQSRFKSRTKLVTPSSLPKPSRIFSRSDRVILLTTPTGRPGLLGAWPLKNRPSGPLSAMALIHLAHLFDWLEPTPVPFFRQSNRNHDLDRSKHGVRSASRIHLLRHARTESSSSPLSQRQFTPHSPSNDRLPIDILENLRERKE
jgi:hypothetical protein